MGRDIETGCLALLLDPHRGDDADTERQDRRHHRAPERHSSNTHRLRAELAEWSHSLGIAGAAERRGHEQAEQERADVVFVL